MKLRDEGLSFVTVLYTMKFVKWQIYLSAVFVGNGAAFKRRDVDADCNADPASRFTLARIIVLKIWNIL